jgi:hypothetical protein
MRAWIGALVIGLSLGCSGGGATNDGGVGGGGGVGGRGGQAGGVAGQAGGVAGQAGSVAGQAGSVAGQAGGVAGQAGGASGTAGASGSGGAAGSGGAPGRGGGAAGQGGSSGASGGGGGLIDGGVSGCGMLAGLAFDSIDERECGLAPPDSGAALCRWRVSFTNATMFTWHHSDYIETGSYTCSANTITAQTQTRGVLTATLDPTIWRFTWDGVVYVCTSCPP